MRLSELLKNTGCICPSSEAAGTEITAVVCDSRKVVPGSMFIAMKGAVSDGNDFIRDALAKGARVIVTADGPSGQHDGVDIIHVTDPKAFLKNTLINFYGDVSRSLNIIGVTGTNGKTTITYLIESILNDTRQACGVIGTVNYRYGGHIFPSNNTTPGMVDLQALLAQMAACGDKYCVMEVSSHALDQGRTDLLDFRTAIFTNLTSDHLDYHIDGEHYFAAKAKLFTALSKNANAVINRDDAYGQRLLSMTKAKIVTYGIHGGADVMAEQIRTDLAGTSFVIRSVWGELNVRTPLIGVHNIYNILGAVAACLIDNISPERIMAGLEHLTCVPGRMERIDCGQKFFVFVDYAHTEDALQNVLTAVRGISEKRIILVFGCGGDRDRTKRPKMGHVASRLADISFVTSDNSRSEDTGSIIGQILAGFDRDNYVVEADRRKAIGFALREAREGDVVLIAGKGHETYQIFKDKTIDFDEREIVRELLAC